MVVDFRRVRPLTQIYRYLRPHLDERLDWSANTDILYRKGQSRLYFLRRLGSFNICRKLLQMFYQTVVSSCLFYAVVCWGGSIKKRDEMRLDKLVRQAGPQVHHAEDPLQFAYREKVGVEDAILYLLHRAHSHLGTDKGCGAVRVMVFFDFSSAFNTIQPLLLRDKLMKMEVDMHLVTWITDYLTGRPQHVRIKDCSSDTVISSTGAPQGTVLSPVLFTLYTSDFKYNSELCHMQKFSDDTAIVGCVRNGQEREYRSLLFEDFCGEWCTTNHLKHEHHQNQEMCIALQEVRGPLSSQSPSRGLMWRLSMSYRYLGVPPGREAGLEVEHLEGWCRKKNFCIKVKKSKEMIVDFRRSRHTHLPLHVGGSAVEVVSSYRYLGVHLSNNLTWSNKTSSLVRKAHQRLYFLRRLRRAGLGSSVLASFYRCVVESVLCSSINVLLCCSAADRKALQMVVKAARSYSRQALLDINIRYANIGFDHPFDFNQLPPEVIQTPGPSESLVLTGRARRHERKQRRVQHSTVIPSKLISKHNHLGISTTLCNWISDFLTDRPQPVKLDNLSSSFISLNTGIPQDDTTVIGLIRDNDEKAYRDELLALRKTPPLFTSRLEIPAELRRPYRGCRAGNKRRERKRRYKPRLPSIIMGNMRSLANKTDKLSALIRTQREYRECSILCFTESWLNQNVPDSHVHLNGFTTVRADRVYHQTGKKRGGGLAVFVNDRWCNPGHITVK
ncbi:hypothetical protein NFI96_002056 [Prochilodus magdalenae]|nr:hypothetical protein NFI96_002056 [Prochilodus magdalenae]